MEMQHVFGDRVYFLVDRDPSTPMKRGFRRFTTKGVLEYFPLCDDFGPMRLSHVVRFIQMLEQALTIFSQDKIVYCVENNNRRNLSNAVFMLGAYLVISHNYTAKTVRDRFLWVNETIAEPFRDATFTRPDFLLHLIDCWQALEQARSLGWLRPPSKEGVWGKYHMAEYEHYDDPSNADLHVVVPGKFIAFRGPRDLGERWLMDDHEGQRHFSPIHYVPSLLALNATAVVRLNEAEYDPIFFTANDIEHVDLPFDDCTAPPASVVASFFAIADRQRGLTAVHCRAGLGRTGTLIALFMMRSCGFTARSAIAWLRIVRPGSVIGEQQHYLCALEQRKAAAPPPPLSVARHASDGDGRHPLRAGPVQTAAASSEPLRRGGNGGKSSSLSTATARVRAAMFRLSRSLTSGTAPSPDAAAGPAVPAFTAPSGGGAAAAQSAPAPILAGQVAGGMARRDSARRGSVLSDGQQARPQSAGD